VLIMNTDLYGTPRPEYDPSTPRFRVFVHSHDADDEPEWQYKLLVVDRAYRDSEGYPIDAIAGGESWHAAYLRAADMIDQALASPTCIF
jgi:hypothetical protein